MQHEAKEIKPGDLIELENGGQLYVFSCEQPKEGYDSDDMFYRPFCSYDEIDRIKGMRNIEDYLLFLRAEVVAEHTRIMRVVLRRMREAGDNWVFSESFNDSHFSECLSELERKKRRLARKIKAGYLFSKSLYGRIQRTKFGDLILVTESMYNFLYYMNLAFVSFDEGEEVPFDVKEHALLIGIRIMLGVEAQDFELDPRGVIPQNIHLRNKHICEEQIKFIIGHEYAHFFLGHLDKNSTYTISAQVRRHKTEHVYYTVRQKDEFAADLHSLAAPSLPAKKLTSRAYYAMLFFMYVDMFEQVEHQIYPPKNSIKTHPAPLDRMLLIAEKFNCKASINLQSQADYLLKLSAAVKHRLQGEVATNINLFEFYGSVYLGSWRGPALVDRVDY